MGEFQQQLTVLKSKVAEIVPEEEFTAMLKKSVDGGAPLRVKCGIDPTHTDIHVGHMIPYRKMRAFQDLGHVGVVIIGDTTALIGDPTGRDTSREALDESFVKENAQKYVDQLFCVLDQKRTEVHFQSEWFGGVGLKEALSWASETTVAKLISRETFKNRLDQGHPLALHEMFYPVLQGMDSVFVRSDVELGGTDQKFNILMGRDYQRARGQRPQVAMLLPIITGTCGAQKMSKSLGNTIGVWDEAFDQFGQVMSIADGPMAEYFTHLTDLTQEQVRDIQEGLASERLHPNEVKKDLAQRIVSLFHGEDTAKEMRQKFESVFKRREVPEDCPQYTLKEGESILDILINSQLVSSKAQARRLAQQGAISVMGGPKITDISPPAPPSLRGQVIRVGKKRFVRPI